MVRSMSAAFSKFGRDRLNETIIHGPACLVYGRKSKNRTNGAARYGAIYGRTRRPASLYENVIRLPSALTPH
jgi:hypothetical protein